MTGQTENAKESMPGNAWECPGMPRNAWECCAGQIGVDISNLSVSPKTPYRVREIQVACTPKLHNELLHFRTRQRKPPLAQETRPYLFCKLLPSKTNNNNEKSINKKTGERSCKKP
jgi:hypothetical protein